MVGDDDRRHVFQVLFIFYGDFDAQYRRTEEVEHSSDGILSVLWFVDDSEEDRSYDSIDGTSSDERAVNDGFEKELQTLQDWHDENERVIYTEPNEAQYQDGSSCF